MMNTLTKTAPPEIHLCIADDADEDYEAFPYDAIDEITWAESPVTDITVRYIRADLSERHDPCKTHCEAHAFRLVIRQQHQALLAAADALETAAGDIAWLGLTARQDGWYEGSLVAKNAAEKARSVAMSGVQP